MEVIGAHNPKSTPSTRLQDRDRAEKTGRVWAILTAQPVLVGYVAIAFVIAGIVEKVYIP